MRSPLTRPFSLSLIVWLLVCWGSWLLVRPYFRPDSPPRLSSYVFAFCDFVLFVGCAIGLFRGREIGRFLFSAIWILTLVLAVLKPSAGYWVRVVFLGFCTYLLFRPSVTEYFVTVASLRDPDLAEWPLSRRRR